MSVEGLWGFFTAFVGVITTTAAAWRTIKPLILKPINETNESVKQLAKESKKTDSEIKQQLAQIRGQIKCLDEQLGTIQREKMMWAYHYYGIKHHPISIETRMSLQAMYDQYTADNKHNHVPHDFKDKINSAPLDHEVNYVDC